MQYVTIQSISVVYRVVLMKKASTIYNRLFLPLGSPKQRLMALATHLQKYIREAGGQEIKKTTLHILLAMPE